MQSEDFGEPSELAREPDQQGEEPCLCLLTLSLFGLLPPERVGLPWVCVGMPDVFGQHPCECGRMPDPFGQEPLVFGQAPQAVSMGPRRRGTDAPIEGRDALPERW